MVLLDGGPLSLSGVCGAFGQRLMVRRPPSGAPGGTVRLGPACRGCASRLSPPEATRAQARQVNAASLRSTRTRSSKPRCARRARLGRATGAPGAGPRIGGSGGRHEVRSAQRPGGHEPRCDDRPVQGLERGHDGPVVGAAEPRHDRMRGEGVGTRGEARRQCGQQEEQRRHDASVTVDHPSRRASVLRTEAGRARSRRRSRPPRPDGPAGRRRRVAG